MTTTFGGASITAARSRKPRPSCAGAIQRFANASGDCGSLIQLGDPSLLYDGVPHRNRIALETYRDARAVLALIREAVEDCAPRAQCRARVICPQSSLLTRKRWLVASTRYATDRAGANGLV